MANYKLIIEQRQPACELEITHKDDESIVIKLDHSGLWVKYEFTKD